MVFFGNVTKNQSELANIAQENMKYVCLFYFLFFLLLSHRIDLSASSVVLQADVNGHGSM